MEKPPIQTPITSPLLEGKSDVVIVGGGVVGVACALELARRGAAVTLLERDRIGHGCSYGNAGWITPSLALPLPSPGLILKAARWMLDPESPFYLKPRLDPALIHWLIRFLAATRRSRFERGAAALIELSRFSVDAWEALSREAPEPFGFARSGLLAIYETPEGYAAGRVHAELVARSGVTSEQWSADMVREREPAIRGAQVGAIFYPQDAHCEPYPAMVALSAAARRAGVRVLEDSEVYGVEHEGGAVRSLQTTRGRISPGQLVIAAGTWSRRLGRRLGLRLPILGAKGYSLLVPRLDPHPTRSLMLSERKIALNPHKTALRISGTLELVDEGDLSINQRRVAAIADGARRMLAIPGQLDVREVWRGLRPCTPDGLPLIGRARGFGNLWLATGHQMTGVKTAPATGRLLAELMTGAPPSFDPAPFRADRY